MKRPAFQFYAADWRKDAALQSCSIAAQGLWINVMCIAHECEPYGHLSVNGKPMQPAQLARLVGLTAKECDKSLTELDGAGVFSRADDGSIYSRRMVRDERLRNIRAESGRLGGNPNLLGDKVNQKDNHSAKQKPTPSSSSSPSGLSGATAPEAPDGASVPDCPHEKVVEIYHELLPTCPRVMDWNETRRGYLRSRWREWAAPKPKRDPPHGGYTTTEDGLKFWRKVLGYCARSPFLTGGAAGRNGQPPFVADLEWIVKPQNFSKIIEGKYHRDVT